MLPALGWSRVLGDRTARRIWLAGLAIGVVRWLEMLAFALWALETTRSPVAVAATSFARLLPLLLLGVPLTGLLEARDRRRVVQAGVLAMLATSLAMLAASLGDRLGLPLLLAAAFANGIFWTIEQPVRRTLLGETVGLEHAAASMGLEAASAQLTRLLGTVAGGAVVAFLGLDGVFLAAAALYALALAALIGARPASRRARRPGPARDGGLWDGLAAVRRDRLLLGAVLVTLIFNLWGFPWTALAPVIAERRFGLDPAAIGLLLGVDGLAGVLAALWIVARARPTAFRRIYTGGVASLMLGVIGYALAPSPLLALPCLFAAGAGMAGFSAMQMTIPLAAAPPALRLRVLGVVTTAIGTAPLGFLLVGLLGERLGPQPALLSIAGLGLAATALLVLWIPELIAAGPPGASAAQGSPPADLVEPRARDG
ncbi:MAG: MFS transporter [Geminicoccaceae bacterium]|nr:MFS transporter [Geminicoccaceae bacterium]MCX8100146.1 MFS transporter [Geminicoccaceae bacterium]MDW8369260.1 MFS transporter [Geminicoccaceae bacterium]